MCLFPIGQKYGHEASSPGGKKRSFFMKSCSYFQFFRSFEEKRDVDLIALCPGPVFVRPPVTA